MSFQYDFPSELLLAIFGKVESYKDHLTLATTCRRFNYLSLRILFSNHNFDPNSKTIILQPYDRSLDTIPALAMSLALRGTSLEHLSFNPGCVGYDIKRLIHRIRTFIRYIMGLTTIDRVTLHIMIPDDPLGGDWQTAYVALLDTLIRKSCSNLHVETYQLSGENQERYDLLSISKTPGWFRRLPGRFWPPVVAAASSKQSNGQIGKHLKEYSIRTFPTFLRPFYLRILEVNAPVLTVLAFESIFGRMAVIDWGYLLTNVHLPALKRFAVSFSVIPRDAMIKFLSKHPHITNFEYHRIKYTSEPKVVPPRGLNGVFKHLEQLTTTAEHILRFLPTMDRIPLLTSVTIIIEEGHMDFTIFEQALKHLSSCVKKIELIIDISTTSRLGALPELLYSGSSLGTVLETDGFIIVRHVKSLHILWEWRYTANDLGQIPTWLKRFPELTKLTLDSSRPISRWLVVEGNTLSFFFEQVKIACPMIESIYLHGESELTLLEKYYSSSKSHTVH